MAIGVDIEDISRFKNKSKDFFERIFTKKEIEYCSKYKNPESHYAVRFCAKEAAIKALSSFNINIAEYKAIEIYNSENGTPNIHILKDVDKNIEFEVSLSHDHTKAIAVVLAKK